MSNVKSLAVPTGIGDTVGNKGGIGIACCIAESRFVFINAHLAEHQHATARRTQEFRTISNVMATKILQNVLLENATELVSAVAAMKGNVHVAV